MEYQNNSNFQITDGKANDILDEPRKKPSELRTKKRGLGQKFKDTFIKGDVHDVANGILTEYLIPYILDGITSIAHNFIDGMLTGETVGYYYSNSGSSGRHTNYAGRSKKKSSSEKLYRSNAAKKTKQMDDVLFDNRAQAELALRILRDELEDGHHDCVSIADFYDAYEEATGEAIDHEFPEAKYGWYDLDNVQVMRTRDDAGVAYYIKFPKAELLD